MFGLLSAILWLGNIQYRDKTADSVEVVEGEALSNAAQLMGVPAPNLMQALSRRKITAGAFNTLALAPTPCVTVVPERRPYTVQNTPLCGEMYRACPACHDIISGGVGHTALAAMTVAHPMAGVYEVKSALHMGCQARWHMSCDVEALRCRTARLQVVRSSTWN